MTYILQGPRPSSVITALKQDLDLINLTFNLHISGFKPFQCDHYSKHDLGLICLSFDLFISGVKPFQGDRCIKHYLDLINVTFDLHISGVKPFQCDHCSKTFRTSSSVKIHIRMVSTCKWDFYFEVIYFLLTQKLRVHSRNGHNCMDPMPIKIDFSGTFLISVRHKC